MKIVPLQIFNDVLDGPGSQSTTTYSIEIIVMLLGAFILGYLLRLFINSSKTVEETELEKHLKEENSKLNLELTHLKDKVSDSNMEIQKIKMTETESVDVSIYENEISNLKLEVSQLTTDLKLCKETIILPLATEIKKDNLKKVEGIGPKIEQLLFEDKIYTFKQLAASSIELIQSILDKAGDRYRIHDPSTWPEQAKLAAEDKWEDLKIMQDQLKGGRK